LKRQWLILAAGIACSTAWAPAAWAQSLWVERLADDALPLHSPATRVRGEPGRMQVIETGCHAAVPASVRQRIVDVALQEWAYFGFSVADETVAREPVNDRNAFAPGAPRFPRNFSWLDADTSARLAASIAGYWTITGDGSWILSRQNENWTENGVGARWRDPWSAAFISWVMCESGLVDDSRFERAINHHTYIDQAIRARDRGDDASAYVAYDVGEQRVEPGDLLCAARRPTLHSLQERRTQLGDGIRSHCDIVVKVEPEQNRILGVGGNVRGTVSLKLLPADFAAGSGAPEVERIGRGRSQIFAHLKLRDAPVAGDPLRASPTLRRIGAEPELLNRVRAVLDSAVSALSRSIL